MPQSTVEPAYQTKIWVTSDFAIVDPNSGRAGPARNDSESDTRAPSSAFMFVAHFKASRFPNCRPSLPRLSSKTAPSCHMGSPVLVPVPRRRWPRCTLDPGDSGVLRLLGTVGLASGGLTKNVHTSQRTQPLPACQLIKPLRPHAVPTPRQDGLPRKLTRASWFQV